jgi:hypothetical protein
MKERSILLLVALAGLTCSISNASITNVTAYGGTAVDCYFYSFGSPGDLFTMMSHQNAKGKIWGNILTDTAEDPTLTLQNTIDNQTAFSWTAYHVDVSMNNPFAIASPSVLNSGWTFGAPVQPVWNGSAYVGQIDFYAGTPVAIGQILSFSYQIVFSGATSFNFTESLTPVPEPGVLSLLLGGGLLLAGSRTVSRRQD